MSRDFADILNGGLATALAGYNVHYVARGAGDCLCGDPLLAEVRQGASVGRRRPRASWTRDARYVTCPDCRDRLPDQMIRELAGEGS